LVIDLDSFIGEVHGYDKQGAGYGYTRTLGYHPLIATRQIPARCCTSRNRHGSANTQRGAEHFVEELLARVSRAGHTSQIVLRADSGFENHKLMNSLDRRGVEFSIGVKQSKPIRALVAQIPENESVTVEDYPETGEAQIAQTQHPHGWGLIVRRTRLVGDQTQLWPDWRYHCFATNRTVPPLTTDTDHRDHATVELVIRDLKDQALAHFPSGHIHANSAWTVIAALAHNLARWSTLIGLPTAPVQTAQLRRRQMLQIPGRLTRTSRRWTLRLPGRWPWKTDFVTVLDALRAFPLRPDPRTRRLRRPADPPRPGRLTAADKRAPPPLGRPQT
jgi:hypothetical protein